MSSGRTRGSAQWDGRARAAYSASGYIGGTALSRTASHNPISSVPSGPSAKRISWTSREGVRGIGKKKGERV